MITFEKVSVPKSFLKSRIILFGEAGVGKSTFAFNMTDKMLFMDLDKGIDFLSGANKNVEAITSWEQVDEMVNAFIKSDFEILCIDTVKKFIDLAEAHICKLNKVVYIKDVGYGAGYTATKKLFYNMLDRITVAKKGVIMLAHPKVKTLKTAEGMEWTATCTDLPTSYENEIIGLCDFIFYAYKNQKNEHTLRTKATKYVNSVKDRSGKLPELMTMDAKKIVGMLV